MIMSGPNENSPKSSMSVYVLQYLVRLKTHQKQTYRFTSQLLIAKTKSSTNSQDEVFVETTKTRPENNQNAIIQYAGRNAPWNLKSNDFLFSFYPS